MNEASTGATKLSSVSYSIVLARFSYSMIDAFPLSSELKWFYKVSRSASWLTALRKTGNFMVVFRATFEELLASENSEVLLIVFAVYYYDFSQCVSGFIVTCFVGIRNL